MLQSNLSVWITILFVSSVYCVTRYHYITAEEIIWNYGPSGINAGTGLPLDEDPNARSFFTQSEDRIGGTYKKAVYVEYTDDTFTQVKEREEYLGFIGPVLYAEVGDTIQVLFINKLPVFNATMHVHGVLPGKAPAVLPGANYTWNWAVPSRSGPGRDDFSSLIYPYHSNIKGAKDSNAGLVGAIVVTGKGMARPDGHPIDVDREYILWYEIFDESSSFYYSANLNTYLPQQVNNSALLTSVPFKNSLLRSCINGFSYGNIPVLTMKVGERVRWYSIGLGGVRDVHSVHWNGITGINPQNVRVDGEIIVPVKTSVVDIIPDTPGSNIVECHVNDHYDHGMFGIFTIEATDEHVQRSYATTYDPWDVVPKLGPFEVENESSGACILMYHCVLLLLAVLLL